MKRVFKVKEIISILISQGWYMDRQNGTSHRQFKHPTIRSTATVNGKLSEVIWIENLKRIERQTGINFKNLTE